MKTIHPKACRIFLALCAVPWAASAQQDSAVSEKDFFSDMPVVLSVSRLPQRLDETPGAVTVLDRQTIRRSGARDVADLLRQVPGFMITTSFESNTPQASYHGSWGDFSNRVQVMVDGRSVYSPFFMGSTGPGLQAVALDDIERIEVLRGSNSAAYGARAFLGTINIVTRDPVETIGVQAQATTGDNGIRDVLARVGWGGDRAAFRLSLDRREDGGLGGAGGRTRVERVNFRGDISTSLNDRVELRMGQSLINAGVGFAGQEGNALRDRGIDTSFVQVDWRRNLGVDEDLAVQFSHMAERTRDNFPFVPIPGMVLDFGGRASNDNLSLQHTRRWGPSLRVVWGGELRQERVASRPQFNTDDEFKTDFSRLFANAEWRFQPDWVLNAGGMLEHSSLTGSQAAPRLMMHWHLAPGHTLRAGTSHAYRTPSMYEKYANVRYYVGGTLLDVTSAARGGVRTEYVQAREIGYMINDATLGLSADVRLYQERVRDFIGTREYLLDDGPMGNGRAFDYGNDQDFDIRGLEYQVKWRPWAGGQVSFGHAYVSSGWTDRGTFQARPHNSANLIWTQDLPHGLNLTLAHYYVDGTNFPGTAEPLAPHINRTDLRLAKALRFGGGRRGELALVVQNLGPAYQDFLPSFYFHRQAYLMLRLEN